MVIKPRINTTMPHPYSKIGICLFFSFLVCDHIYVYDVVVEMSIISIT
jgi:hypothetical protein